MQGLALKAICWKLKILVVKFIRGRKTHQMALNLFIEGRCKVKKNTN